MVLIEPSSLPAPLRRYLWRGAFELLPRHMPRADWTCMNYGHADVQAVGPLRSDQEPERACLALYAHILGGQDVVGRRIVEVGSGRGGGLAWVHARGALRSVGVDFSRTAVQWCREHHSAPGLAFVWGEAEALPLPDASADLVLDVESSHCYGDLGRYCEEVARVLAPGGHFLLADFRDADGVSDLVAAVAAAGLEIWRFEDVTADVVAALEADRARRAQWFEAAHVGWLRGALARVSAVPGTAMHRAFVRGSTRYVVVGATRPRASGPSTAVEGP